MDRSLHILSLSAPTEESLNHLIKKYKDHLQSTTDSFQDAAYNTNINTANALFDHRAVIVANDNQSALKIMKEKSYISSKVGSPNEHQKKPKLCMLFPGQGSQYPGMAKQLYSTSPLFKYHFDQCCKILDKECANQLDLKEILWNCTGIGSCGDATSQLNTSINSQIAIFCVNFCLFKLWTSWGVKPDYVLGHSLGESAAVVAVGVRDLRNGLKALLLRTKRIDKLGSGKMIAVKADKVTVKKMIQNFCASKPNNYWLDIAALNSPEQTVLSGECDTVQDFYKFCRAAGVISIIIASTHAFHSRMLDPAMEDIRKGLITIKSEFSENTSSQSCIKYISSSEARIIGREELSDENYWVANTRNTVRFAEACQAAFREGCQIFIEVGPQSVLSTLVKVNFGGRGKNVGKLTCLPSLSRNGNDWETLLNSLASYWLTTRGSEIDWNEFDKPYQAKITNVFLTFNPFISKLDSNACAKFDYHLIGKCREVVEDLVIFQNELEPNLFNFGQGTFLAICVTAAGAVHQNEGSNGKFWAIKDFKIIRNANFLNADLKNVRVLTKVSLSTSHVKVFLAISKVSIKMDNEWIEHCSATFENNLNDGVNPGYFYLNLKLRKEKWEKRVLEKTKNPITDFTGLNFQNIWSELSETGNKSLLVSFQVKPSELPGKLCENYLFIHHVIICAMIQLTSLLQREIVPAFEVNAILNTCVKTFCILDKLKLSKDEEKGLELYLFLRVFDNENEQPANFSVWLINSKGRALALMEGMTM